MAQAVRCGEIDEDVLRAYAEGKSVGLAGRWALAAHFRTCAGCAAKYLRWSEGRSGFNPWVGAEPIGLVQRKKHATPGG
jgi:hypothetical protein